jgi:hypothetical protein
MTSHGADPAGSTMIHEVKISLSTGLRDGKKIEAGTQ